MSKVIPIRSFVGVILISMFCAPAGAQTTSDATAPKAVGQKKVRSVTRVAPVRVTPVVVQNRTTAPQVVTILHGLNGLKIFRLLLRSNELAAIATLDETFQIDNEIHTNVIAGLALDDGRTIAVWLPEAGAEMSLPSPPDLPDAPEAPLPHAPSAVSPKAAPARKSTTETDPAALSIADFPPVPFADALLQPADLKVVTRDGKRLLARYVGLDGLTGLSVISLTNSSLPQLVAARDEIVIVGQRLRLIGPEPASQSSPNVRAPLYVRIGETEATVFKVNRTASGLIRRVMIKSAKLSRANIGGIAINDAGETVGIVDAIEGYEASIVPLASVRSAVKRVIERQASVPRPWLGIHGEPIGALSYERILRVGWQAERARALAQKRQGILLTSVIPGSPAAMAQLRPGDVILRVNNDEVRNAEDFTWLLDGAVSGNSLKFTVARPEKAYAEALEIQLGESPDPWFGVKMFGGQHAKEAVAGSLLARGIETIALKPPAAVHFGASGGLLVVYVEPATDAFKAGLQPGDVIEAINGQRVFARPVPMTLLHNSGKTSTFSVVRNKQKIVITIDMK